MPIKITKPGRLQSGTQAAVPVPSNATGGAVTGNVRTRMLSPPSVNASALPLTVQRQTFTHPIKKQGYS